MNLPDSDVKCEFVDGQLVLIPTTNGWARLRNDTNIDGVTVYFYENMVDYNSGLAERYVGQFAMALFRPGPRAPWSPILLLRDGDRWQRVMTISPTCDVCGWRGVVASPTPVVLFIGVHNKAEAERRGDLLPTVPCPQCGSWFNLVRPIWAEPLESSDEVP